MEYLVRRTTKVPELQGKWSGAVWKRAETLTVANFRAESSDHRPKVQARLLYDAQNVYGLYRVEDRYIRAVADSFQGMVCRDSCVEFFFRPGNAKGYFNFEFNCGGTFLVFYVIDDTRTADGFKDYVKLTDDDGRQVRMFHSMPTIVEPEIAEKKTWSLEFAIPLAMLARYTGPLADPAGQVWNANLYKCGDQTSHPHWASWNPVDELNFHLPRCFGQIRFE